MRHVVMDVHFPVRAADECLRCAELLEQSLERRLVVLVRTLGEHALDDREAEPLDIPRPQARHAILEEVPAVGTARRRTPVRTVILRVPCPIDQIAAVELVVHPAAANARLLPDAILGNLPELIEAETDIDRVLVRDACITLLHAPFSTLWLRPYGFTHAEAHRDRIEHVEQRLQEAARHRLERMLDVRRHALVNGVIGCGFDRPSGAEGCEHEVGVRRAYHVVAIHHLPVDRQALLPHQVVGMLVGDRLVGVTVEDVRAVHPLDECVELRDFRIALGREDALDRRPE